MKKLAFNEKNPCVCEAGSRMYADAIQFHACAEIKGKYVHYGDLTVETPEDFALPCVVGNVRIAASCAGMKLEGCRIEGDLVIEADGVSVLSTVVTGSLAVTAEKGSVLRDCTVAGSVSVAADDAQVMYCTAEKIALGAKINQIVALCSAREITVDGAKNTVVLKNKADAVAVQNCSSVYVIENVIGTLTLTNNSYVNADCNAVENTVSNGNTYENGNNLMDVDARLPVGADMNLLLHSDPDLFVGMERKTTVTDPDVKGDLTLPTYVNTLVVQKDFVIIPPGAYVSDEAWIFGKEASNTVIYAYGVYAERQKDCTAQAKFAGVFNVTVKGLFFAFAFQSCGQAYILEMLGKDEDGKHGWVRVVTGAGMIDEFGNYGTHFDQSGWMGAQREGTFYAYCDSFYKYLEPTEEDGTHRMCVEAHIYDYLKKGDILTTRLNGGGVTIPITHSGDIMFYDFTMYGAGSGFAWVENDNLTATTYFRVNNTTRTAEVIDEAEYNKYRALEEKYGVSLEVYRDGLGRFRGSPPHIGSIDATHTTRCAQGSVCISCLFENMSDDGTNQNHTHARIAAITDNGDGTATVEYKGLLTVHTYNLGNRIPRNCCADFKVGDRVYIYNSGGQLICNTPALTATEHLGMFPVPEYGTDMPMMRVKVALSAINFKGLEGYDLSANTPNDKPGDKVLIDNMSQASNGFIFDNTVVRNVRSRGLLVKASECQMVNCSFVNIGMSCAAILYEIFWGESGVTENMLVARNVFDHTGYFNTEWDRYAPIAIEGLGSRVDEDYLLYKNIVITDNVIRNRTTKYAVFVNSAQGIYIRNNDFGTGDYAADVHINGAMNIELSGNTYSSPKVARRDAIVVQHAKNIYGSDVEENGVRIIADCE